MFNDDDQYLGPSPDKAKRRVYAQSLNILRQIVDSYLTGALDDPSGAHRLCTLFAMVAEGKVRSCLDDTTGKVKWSLDDKYREMIDARLASSDNIVPGPWKENKN